MIWKLTMKHWNLRPTVTSRKKLNWSWRISWRPKISPVGRATPKSAARLRRPVALTLVGTLTSRQRCPRVQETPKTMQQGRRSLRKLIHWAILLKCSKWARSSSRKTTTRCLRKTLLRNEIATGVLIVICCPRHSNLQENVAARSNKQIPETRWEPPKSCADTYLFLHVEAFILTNIYVSKH